MSRDVLLPIARCASPGCRADLRKVPVVYWGGDGMYCGRCVGLDRMRRQDVRESRPQTDAECNW